MAEEKNEEIYIAQISEDSGPFRLPSSLDWIEVVEESTTEAGESLEELISIIDSEIEEAAPLISTEGVQATASATGQRYIVFTLAETKYAVPLGSVIEMGRIPKITSVPLVPDWIKGVTNLRGDILSVIDLRSFLNIAPLDRIETGRMLVVRSGQGDVTAGLIVDQVKGLRELSDKGIVPPSTSIQDKVVNFLGGVHGAGEDLLAVIDMERFFSLPELRQFGAA